MRRVLTTAATAALVVVGLAAPSWAADVADWSANGESGIVDHNTVRLQGDNTSVETGNLGINVDEGAEIKVEYKLVNGAQCDDGEPRIFAEVNGTIGVNKSTQCDGGGLADDEGVLSFNTDRAGLIERFGLVHESDGAEGEHVLLSNLTVGGEPVYFAAPPVEVTPEAPTVKQYECSDDGNAGELVIPGQEGVTYDHEGGPVAAGDYTITATADDGYKLAGEAEWTLTVAPVDECGDQNGDDTGKDDQNGDDTGNGDQTGQKDHDQNGKSDEDKDDNGKQDDDDQKGKVDNKDDDTKPVASSLPTTGAGPNVGLIALVGGLVVALGAGALLLRHRLPLPGGRFRA